MNTEIEAIEKKLEKPSEDIPMYEWINLAEYARAGLEEATRAVNDAYKLGAMMGGDMTESQKMALEICKGYEELKPKYRLEFLDFCIDFWKGKIPDADIKALEELREYEQSKINRLH